MVYAVNSSFIHDHVSHVRNGHIKEHRYCLPGCDTTYFGIPEDNNLRRCHCTYTAGGIRHADHVAPSIRTSWQSLRRQAAVARSV
jgi:hypothetical protein